MKTWEMIKELTEHPKKKFAGITEDTNCSAYPNGCFVLNTGIYNPSLRTNWHEVKQTVGWDKALEYMRKGEEKHVKLCSTIYRINTQGYLQVHVEGVDWEPAYIRTDMLDSKEWELL